MAAASIPAAAGSEGVRFLTLDGYGYGYGYGDGYGDGYGF